MHDFTHFCEEKKSDKAVKKPAEATEKPAEAVENHAEAVLKPAKALEKPAEAIEKSRRLKRLLIPQGYSLGGDPPSQRSQMKRQGQYSETAMHAITVGCPVRNTDIYCKITVHLKLEKK